jgi:hypothetical protein
VLSLLLCVATVALWARSNRQRSYRLIDALLLEHGWSVDEARYYSSFDIVSVQGALMLVNEREADEHEQPWHEPEDAYRNFDGWRARWAHNFQYMWVDQTYTIGQGAH